MTDQFEKIETGVGFIHVRHSTEGHRYRFPVVVAADGRRILGFGNTHPNGRARHSAEFFETEARAFAENEARNAGIVD